jgi:hypothetical protein
VTDKKTPLPIDADKLKKIADKQPGMARKLGEALKAALEENK